MKIYLVGGAVRNHLLKIPIMDKDWVVVGATPDDFIARGFKQVGKDFPVFLHPDTKEEYAFARREKKMGPGYTGFTCYAGPEVSLEDDLMRRDLTINAIAMTESGELIDPFQGQADLQHRILRHVSPAFIEDPLRILRVARFAAQLSPFNFSVAEETMQLMRALVRSGELSHLATERIWQESEKALKAPNPALFFQILRFCGALEVLFPEINQLFGVPNPPHYHPEIDSGIHTLMVLTQASLLSDDPCVRFAALTHDLGKGVTPWQAWPKHHGHDVASVSLIHDLCQRLRPPNIFKEMAVLVAKFHTRCHESLSFSARALVKLLEAMDAYRRPERFEKALLACMADSRGRPSYETKAYPQAAWLSEARKISQEVDLEAILKKVSRSDLIGEVIHRARWDKVDHWLTEKRVR